MSRHIAKKANNDLSNNIGLAIGLLFVICATAMMLEYHNIQHVGIVGFLEKIVNAK